MWGTTWAITCRLIGQRAADCQRETKYTIWNKTHIRGVQQMYVVFIVEQEDATCITYYIL